MLQLASASPRRAALLRQIGVAFHQLNAVAIDETARANEPAVTYVARLAAAKACAGQVSVAATDWVLGADTCVVCDTALLGKPRDRTQAKQQLMRLAGRRHRVVSGVCLRKGARCLETQVTSQVRFAALDAAQLEAYLDCEEWRGKAGGYAIQGFAAAFVCELVGSYSNVVGLPLFETTQLLRQAGISCWQRL